MKEQRKYFGTDGIRGKVGNSLIHPEFVIKLGWAVGRVLSEGKSKGRVLIGKDTRISGYMLESSLEAGLSAAGVDIQLLGPMPTPAIAYLTRTLRANAGIVISASHNAYYDNGIKFFSADGRKLPDSIEVKIEKEMEKTINVVDSKNLGKASRVMDAPGRYIEFCKSTVPAKTRLDGLRIVIDCANGATYHIAPHVFKELGAEVISIGVEPSGLNINKNCGSTNPKNLQQTVLKERADVGVALDGDGDRVILVDNRGKIVDGDEILYLIARYYQETNQLHGGVVGTVMTNMGLEFAFKELGIDFVRSPVGDRYVIEELIKRQWILGGESSGHIINFNFNETGDGIVAALQVLSTMNATGKSLRDLMSGMKKYPQIINNISLENPQEFLKNSDIQEIIRKIENQLGQHGRVLVRASGTEPVIRVMVEGQDEAKVTQLANVLSDLIRARIPPKTMVI